MFRCTVCGINATSEKNFQEHLRGWNHLKKLDSLKVAEKSVYIRGFAPDLTQATLQSFLEEQVGSVSSVWLNKEITYALVEFKNPADALKALQTPGISLSGKKLVIKPRQVQRPEKTPEKTPQSPGTSADSASKQQKNVSSFQNMEDVLGKEVNDILQIPELEGQLKHLADLNRMSSSMLESQLLITFQLLKLLRQSFPHCLLVPFGSAISGLGTQHSDCDLCLVLSPPASLTSLLSGQNYFSPTLLPIVERLEREYDLQLCPPPLPLTDVKMSPEWQEEERIASTATTSLSPPKLSRINRIALHRPLFEEVCAPLRRSKDYERILPLLGARCPIISLGPLNSRLVRSYCEFDQRVPILISVLKLWTHVIDIPKKQLNSYGISLMVVYFLQRCSPPVLPCLQSPGEWARNMQWFGQKTWKDETLNNQLDIELVAPWDVSFTPPNAFHPSINSESTVSLLHGFFKFYSTFDYQKGVVSIKANNKKLTVSEAILEAKERNVEPHRFNTALIVQDPFELSHNVTKMVSPGTYHKWRESVLHASQLLEAELAKGMGSQSILSLFDVVDDVPKAAGSNWSVPLQFSQQRIIHLLQQTNAVTLAQQLPELDLSSLTVRKDLGRLVLRIVVKVLVSRYGFTCGEGEEGGGAVHEEGEASEEQGEEMAESMEEGMETVSEVEPERRKRKRVLHEEEMVTDHKRNKVQESAVNALDILRGVVREEPHPCSYVCTVRDNTWLHARRARRHGYPEQEGEASVQPHVLDGLQANLDDFSLLPSVLKLQVYLLQPGNLPQGDEQEVCVLKVKRIEGSHEDYFTFLAVLKKVLYSGT